MKIGMITDIHLKTGDEEAEQKDKDFKQFLSTLRVDILLVTGDVNSNRFSEFEKFYRMVRESDPYLTVCAVRGNHEAWCIDMPFSNLVEIENKQMEVFKKYNIHYLEHNKYENEKIIIYGFDGWYKHTNTGTNDKDMMPNNSGMGELTPFQHKQRNEVKALDYIFDELEKDKESTKKKLVATHFNLIPNVGYEHMSGNDRYLDLITPEVDYLVFGHTHRVVDEVVNNCRVINVGADYDQSPRLDMFYEEIEL